MNPINYLSHSWVSRINAYNEWKEEILLLNRDISVVESIEDKCSDADEDEENQICYKVTNISKHE